MFNNIYRLIAHLGAIIAAFAKAHEVWTCTADPMIAIIKIIGILIIIWIIFTPNDLLQDEG